MALSEQLQQPVSPVSQTALLPEGPTAEVEAPAVPGRFGWIAALSVALFAFLLASLPARNGDVWRDLAAGRDLAHGLSSPGTLSSHGSAQALAPGWLYDLAVYALYRTVGGPGLVLIKALAIAAVSLLLVSLGRLGQSWWLPALCTSVAVLAMSTRLLLQPATVSLVFLAIAFWLVESRRRRQARTREGTLLVDWPLMLLFVIWANLDGWFVLGLATVALLWLGETLDSVGQAKQLGEARKSLQSSSIRFLASVVILAAVCLLNPLHFHAFHLPAGTRWLEFLQESYLRNIGLTPAGLAYFPLLGLGLLSFALNLPRWHWYRFLPWLGLAVASLAQVRTVPFFAVLAGPVLAWNLHDFFALHSESERRQAPQWGWTVLVLRALSVVLGLAFLLSAWPGWLQAPPFEPRRWAIEPAPSLERGAAAIRSWHQDGRLNADTRALHLSPDSLSAFAWFCPEEKGVLDPRLTATILGTADAPEDGQEQLRAAGIHHVIVYDPNPGRLLAALNTLLSDPEQWPLLYEEGDLAVFGWRDPDRPSGTKPLGTWSVDFERLAFQPSEDKKAPATAPDWKTAERHWWDAFLKRAPGRPMDREEASLYLLHAEALRRTAPYRHLAAWEASHSAGLVAAAGGWAAVGAAGSAADAQLRLLILQPPLPDQTFTDPAFWPLVHLVQAWQKSFSLQRDDSPPALLYLAIRAARRALAVNPQDAQAYLLLGESYIRLLHDTRERAWGELLPEVVQLRRAQASAALYQALALKPDLTSAHLHLASLYHDLGYLDLTLDHLRNYVRLTRQSGPPAGESVEQFRQELARYDEEVSKLASAVEDRENAYLSSSARLKRVDRVQLAMQKRLAGKALTLLLESNIAAFGEEGMAIELELLLRTGRSHEVLDWAGPEQQAALGATGYYPLRIQALAASGEYAAARDELARGDQRQIPQIRSVMAAAVAEAVMEGCPSSPSLPWMLWKTFPLAEFSTRITNLAESAKQAANRSVLKGLLLLEEGEVDDARAAFRQTLDIWKGPEAVASGAALDFGGRVVVEDCLRWLEKDDRPARGVVNE
jgi:hypothetical protein